MAEVQLVEERIISGTGVLRIPNEENKLRYAVLYLDLIRPSSNMYVNRNWNPQQSKYAFITFIRNGYVIADADMKYDRYCIDAVADIAGQTLIAVKCAYAGTLQTFFNLGNALLLPSISVNDTIKDYENLNLLWDEMRVKCYGDAAIQARLFKLEYDTCEPDRDRQRRPPPPPPPRPRVPPRTPIPDIDTPYNDPDNPDNETDPHPIDDQPGVAVILRITWGIGANGNLGGQEPVTADFTVPDRTYIPELRAGIDPPPGTCASIPGIAEPNPPLQTTVAVGQSGDVIRLFYHQTCNIIYIIDYEYIDIPQT